MSAPVRFLPLVDTHAHLNLDAFAADLDDVVARSRSGRFPEIRGRRVEDALFRPFVAAAVCPAVDLESSLRSLELSRRFDALYAAVGIHPNHAALAEPGDWEAIERLALAAVDAKVDANAPNAPDVPPPQTQQIPPRRLSTAPSSSRSAKPGSTVIGTTRRSTSKAPFSLSTSNSVAEPGSRS